MLLKVFSFDELSDRHLLTDPGICLMMVGDDLMMCLCITVGHLLSCMNDMFHC